MIKWLQWSMLILLLLVYIISLIHLIHKYNLRSLFFSNEALGRCGKLFRVSLGHGLCTLTAVPRSTQPSTLCGMVKWVSALGWVIIINGDGGCGFWPPTGGLTARVVWPGLRVGGRLAPCHIHHMNRVNSRSGFELRWQHHKYCRWYYYYYYYRENWYMVTRLTVVMIGN